MLFRARVIRVHRQQLNQDRLTFTCDVAPIGADVQGANGIIEQVPFLMPGFGSISPNTIYPPTGIVFVPEEGSLVLVGRENAGYVIVGYYTGPAKTVESVISSSETGSPLASYNPGVESTSNMVGAMFLGDDREWLFGIKPGDVVLGKGLARVKVMDDGVIIGSSTSNMTMWKANEARIDRCSEYDGRMIGYQKSHRYIPGVEAAAQAHLARPEAVPAPPAGAITTEVFEATPYAYARKAFLLTQRGHITNGILDDARQALLGNISALDVASEEVARLFVIRRDAVIQPTPTAMIGKIPAAETLVDHCIMYDEQVLSNGSWFVRAGNIAHMPTGGQRHTVPGGTLDFDMSYVALTKTFTTQVGVNGAPVVQMSMAALPVPRWVVAMTTPPVVCEIAPSGVTLSSSVPVSITAPAVSVTAPAVSITGNVTITGTLTVSSPASVGSLTVSGPVSAGSLAVSGSASVGSLTASGLVTAAEVTAGGKLLSRAVMS